MYNALMLTFKKEFYKLLYMHAYIVAVNSGLEYSFSNVCSHMMGASHVYDLYNKIPKL